jgi:hypothetical protein
MTIHWHFEKMSPQTVGTGESLKQSAGSRGAVTKYNSGAENNSPELSPVFSHDGIALLKTSYVAQALLDVAALVFGLFFICALAGSLPLAVALMILGVL